MAVFLYVAYACPGLNAIGRRYPAERSTLMAWAGDAEWTRPAAIMGKVVQVVGRGDRDTAERGV